MAHRQGGKKFGRDLVATMFNKDNPVIDVANYHTGGIVDNTNEREGFMLVAMGTMQWCKNIVGHGNVDQISPQDGFARIILINHLLEVINKAVSDSGTN